MRILVAITLFAIPSIGYGAIPSGLSLVSESTPTLGVALDVFSDTAYISGDIGLIVFDGLSSTTPIVPTNDSFGDFIYTTRAVESSNGAIYFGASFDPDFSRFKSGGAAIYQLDAPESMIMEWAGFYASGFDSSLDGFGYSEPWGSGVRLSISGGITHASPLWLGGGEVTPNGVIAGQASPAGTIGSAAAILLDDDSVHFVNQQGFLTSVRDRNDGAGANLGYWGHGANVVQYGDTTQFAIDLSLGYDEGAGVFVSQSDFVVLRHVGDAGYRAFFPGVNPIAANMSVPITEVFPELSSVNIGRIYDIASVEGELYMLFSGDGNLWLYKTSDPSMVPEPNSLAIALLAILSWRNSRGRGVDSSHS